MNIPSRRKLGAIALILAGIAAVGVPLYLWHGGSPSGTSTNPGTTSGNNNSGNTAGNTNPNPNTNNGQHTGSTGDTSGGSTDTGSGGSTSSSCSDNDSHSSHDSDSSDSSTQAKGSDNDNGNGKHNGNAYGFIAKQMDTTVTLVKSMGTHNSAFHQHHDTKTDNDTVHDPQGADHDSNGHDSSCASADDSNDQD